MTAIISGLESDVRPWGHYVVLSDEPTHKVKRIVVEPGKRLSLQRHARRAEHWFLLEGTASVTLGDAVRQVGPGESVDVPRGTAHRISNEGTVPVVLIEVQHGDYFGEDDIERLQDDFGRADL